MRKKLANVKIFFFIADDVFVITTSASTIFDNIFSRFFVKIVIKNVNNLTRCEFYVEVVQ